MSNPAPLAYYNEIDPGAAQWLRNLIEAGAIAPGVVDERDLRDVPPAELTQYTQCHFFAGIGVWSYALRQAGWPDDRPVWTGSCPCQPFSTAGKGAGFDDERHLWPFWHHLIRTAGPRVVFGEQVASKDGLAWLDLVHDDLEGEDYTVRALDTCSAGFGAPHIRQRLWIVAYADRERLQAGDRACRPLLSLGSGDADSLANTPGGISLRLGEQSSVANSGIGNQAQGADRHTRCRSARILGDYSSERRQELRNASRSRSRRHLDRPDQSVGRGATNGFWRAADWLHCRDGRWRAVEPGTSPLVNGTPDRVGRLRGYGNAINAQNAAEVIAAAMDSILA